MSHSSAGFSLPEALESAGVIVCAGTGGVGKTTMAVSLIRDPEIGEAFERLLWVSVSQQPDLFYLLGRLHFQLTLSRLPQEVQEVLDAVTLLRTQAKGVKALLVLDARYAPRMPHGAAQKRPLDLPV